MIINAGINLSKIVKDAIKKSQSGDSWINVNIRLHNPDKYENVLSIQQYTGDKENKPFIGNGKLVIFPVKTEEGESVTEAHEAKMEAEPIPEDDLPF